MVASTAQWVNSAASSVGAMVGGICPARAPQGPGYLLRRVGIDVAIVDLTSQSVRDPGDVQGRILVR